jgi:hypothetical protein
MHTTIRMLMGAVALLLTGLSASAQVFLGSDNFSDNTLTIQGTNYQAPGQWRIIDDSESFGAWTETNQRLEYTTPETVNFDRSFIYWVSTGTSYNRAPNGNFSGEGGAGLPTGDPYTSSWIAQVEVTNNLTSLSTGWSYSGLQIFANTNAYYTLSIYTAPGTASIATEWGKYNAVTTNYDNVLNFVSTPNTTDVLLRMSYNGATKVLTSSYSNDGGSTFLTGATYDLDGAEAGNNAATSGMSVELLVSSYNTGTGIAAGQVYFDNLGVTAVPEPSTYAALAGWGVLGFAVWRRRRAA